MAVMGTGTFKMDEATYFKVFKEVHDLANPPEGLIFHSACVVDGGMFICDFWTSEEMCLNALMNGPLGKDLAAEGVALPTDTKFTEVLNYTYAP
jgi:hypothetical protein